MVPCLDSDRPKYRFFYYYPKLVKFLFHLDHHCSYDCQTYSLLSAKTKRCQKSLERNVIPLFAIRIRIVRPKLRSSSSTFILLLQVLNLFLALLLSSFGASNLSAAGGTDEDTNKLSEAFNRIGRFRRWIKKSVVKIMIYAKERLVECCQRQISARRGMYVTLCGGIIFLEIQ